MDQVLHLAIYMHQSHLLLTVAQELSLSPTREEIKADKSLAQVTYCSCSQSLRDSKVYMLTHSCSKVPCPFTAQSSRPKSHFKGLVTFFWMIYTSLHQTKTCKKKLGNFS